VVVVNIYDFFPWRPWPQTLLSPDRFICLWLGRQCRNAFLAAVFGASQKKASVECLVPENKGCGRRACNLEVVVYLLRSNSGILMPTAEAELGFML
jgi:hypothetical protein